MRLFSAPDNSKIASCGVDRSTLLFDVSSGDIIQRFTGHVEVLITTTYSILLFICFSV